MQLSICCLDNIQNLFFAKDVVSPISTSHRFYWRMQFYIVAMVLQLSIVLKSLDQINFKFCPMCTHSATAPPLSYPLWPIMICKFLCHEIFCKVGSARFFYQAATRFGVSRRSTEGYEGKLIMKIQNCKKPLKVKVVYKSYFHHYD